MLDIPSARCPLCGASLPVRVEDHASADIIARWDACYRINVANEFDGEGTLSLLRCTTCNLEFFLPPITGTPEFYGQLQGIAWYYSSNKQEHSMAGRDISAGSRVLEVGCGTGSFLLDLAERRCCDVVGIDANASAVAEAKARGLDVRQGTIDDALSDGQNEFDEVCCFQTLEHIATPKAFLASLVERLRVGGLLIIGVPDSSGFIRHDATDVMNQPPHHVTRWSQSVLLKLPRMFPLEVVRVRRERLARRHVRWYVHIQLQRLMRRCWRVGRCLAKRERWLSAVLLGSGLHRLFSGHTIYACYQKQDKPSS